MENDMPKEASATPAEPVSTIQKTTREEARRALSGIADTPLSSSRTQQTPALTQHDSLEKKQAVEELTQKSLPSFTPPVKTTPPPPRAPIYQAKPVETPKKKLPLTSIAFIPQKPQVQKTTPESIPPKKLESQNIPQPATKRPLSATINIPPKIQTRVASLADIALSQDEERRTAATQAALVRRSSNSYRHYFILGGAVLFFAIGGTVAIYYAIAGNAIKPVITLQKPTKHFVIKPDIEYALSLGKDTSNIQAQLSEALAKINKADGAIGAFVITAENEKKKQVELAGSALLRALFSPIPNQLVNSLSDDYMAGRYAGSTENSLFFVFSISSYEDAFSGLQNWYPEEATHFAQLFKNNTLVQAQDLSWKNVFIKNIDARILTNDDNDIFLAYTFLTKDKLLISADKESFLALVERYITPQNPIQ